MRNGYLAVIFTALLILPIAIFFPDIEYQPFQGMMLYFLILISLNVKDIKDETVL